MPAGRFELASAPVVFSPIATLASSTLVVQSVGEGFIDLTDALRGFLNQAEAGAGQLTIFLRHTSASLTIQENADLDVLRDLTTALRRLAPEDGGWRHATEGPDDMPAHIKTMLISVSLLIPVLDGTLTLGAWQAVYLIEHRRRPHRREIVLQFAGSRRAA